MIALSNQVKPLITVKRPIAGCTLNGQESLLNWDGTEMKFKTIGDAVSFLKDNGYDKLTMEEIEEYFTFNETC